MWLVRYTYPSEIIYNQGGGFISLEFKNSLIEEEYGIKTKPYSSGNQQANATIERIHQVSGNLIRKFNLHDIYVDDADPWIEILAAATFGVRSTYHRNKQKYRAN